MMTTLPQAVKVWGRGQLTIPKTLREALKLEDETTVNVFLVGRCLIITPKRLLKSGLTKEIEKSMKSKGITLDSLMMTLKEERQRYNKEHYGI